MLWVKIVVKMFSPSPSIPLPPHQYNPEVNRCIGVFGLSLYTGEKDLRELLEEYGKVEEIQVVYDHQVSLSLSLSSECTLALCQ